MPDGRIIGSPSLDVVRDMLSQQRAAAGRTGEDRRTLWRRRLAAYVAPSTEHGDDTTPVSAAPKR